MFDEIYDRIDALTKRRRDFVWILILAIISSWLTWSFSATFTLLMETPNPLLLFTIPSLVLIVVESMCLMATTALFALSIMTLLQRGLN